ncbi:hypothetical protein TNCV_4976721 [Trichonephila clavipes]|nr:hypothetical protein TNCV_4976721 [Trichonephila clavipes]
MNEVRMGDLETLAKQNAVQARVDHLPPPLLGCNSLVFHVKLVLQSTCLVRWFLTENRKMNEQKIDLKFCFKLGKELEETYAMLICVYEDQALSMKCVYEWFVGKVFLRTPVVEDWQPSSVTKTLRK